MKKITLLLAFFLAIVNWGYGQSASSYSFSSSLGTFTENSVAATALPLVRADGYISPAQNIGFTFVYEGVNYTQFKMSSNGFISFSSGAAVNLNTNDFATANAVTRPIIAPLWDDLDGATPASSLATYELTGTAPNRVLTVEWKNWEWNWLSNTPVVSFQVKLYETTNVIEFVYRQESTAVNVGSTGGASIGIGAATGSGTGSYINLTDVNTPAVSAGASITNLVIKPATGQIFTFTPPVACVGTPLAGTLSPLVQNLCSGSTPSAILASGYSGGVSGLTFQWEESDDNGVADLWANVSGGTGATTISYTPSTFTATKYYRLKVTCSNSTEFAYTSSAIVTSPIAPSNQITNVLIPVASIGYNQATINWTIGNGNRRVVYISDSATFTDPVNGSGPALTANTVYSGTGQQLIYDGTAATVNVTGLSGNTTYYIKAYEYTRCGTVAPFSYYFNTSTGTNVASFTTCGNLTVPYLDNFSVYLPGCWQAADNGNLTAGPATFVSSSWTADGLGNNGTTGAARILIDGTGDNDWLLSPIFNIPASGYELKFDAAAAQSGSATPPSTPWETDDFVEVLVSTGVNNWTVLYTFNDFNTPLFSGAPIILDLDAYAGQNVRFAFRGVEGANNGSASIDFSIDNFQIRLTPSCLEPTGLGTNINSSSSVDLNWIPGGSETLWDVQYGLTGFALGTGTIVTNVSNPHTVNSLTPNTTYQFYVRANCGVSGTSAWVGPFSFTTPCVVYTVPSSENFTTYIPTCWQEADNGDSFVGPATFGSSSWLDDGFANNGTTGSARITIDGTTDNDWILSPLYTIPATGYELKFNAAVTQAGGTGSLTTPWENDDYVEVLASNGTDNWVLLYTYNDGNVPSNSGTSNIINLDSFAGQDVRFAFRAFEGTNNGSASVDFFVDNFEIRQTPTAVPSCASNVIATPNATCGNYATAISWNAASGADGYKIKLGTTSGGSEILNNVDLGSALAYNHVGNHNTTYYFTIIAYNTAGDATGCSEVSYTTYVNGCYCPSVPSSNDASGITNVIVGSTNFPTTDVTYFDHTATTVNLTQGLSSNVQITFATGFTYDTNIWIDFNNDYDFNDAGELVRTGIASTDANPTTLNASFTMPLSAPLGQHRMRIGTADSGQVPPNSCYSGTYGVTLDFTVNILPAPSCIPPSALSANVTSSSTATLNWIAAGTETIWNVEYGVTGFAQGTGTVNLGVGNPHPISSLAPNTTYQFYVQANCAGNGLSTWAGPFSFTTLCNAINTLPHAESFDAVAVPSCWSTALVSGTTNWAPDDQNDGVPGPKTGGRFMGKSWAGNDEALLISPKYDLSAYATNQARLNVWIYRSANGLATDRTAFYVNTTNNLTGATQLLDIPLPISATPTVASAGWYNYLVNIPLSYNTGGDFYIIAQGKTTSSFSSYSLGFDDYVLELAPTCEKPINLSATVNSSSTATLNWVAGGSENTWNIEYGVTGFTQGSGTLVSNITPTPSYSLSSLSVNTSYQYYVQANCGGANGVSTWAGPFTFYVGHCVPSGTNNSTYINNFVTTGTGPNITNNGSGFSVSNYGDYYSSINVSRASNQSFNFTADIVSGTVGCAIWVDWNNNLTFETTERVYNTTAYGSGPFSGSITVPNGTANGDYRMRVLIDWNAPNPANPCGFVSGRGEVEDYKIIVDSSLSNQEFDFNSFKVYPNPVTDILNLSYSKEISKISVYNLLGQEVLVKYINALQTEVDLSRLSSGTYLVKVTVDSLENTIKIVKK